MDQDKQCTEKQVTKAMYLGRCFTLCLTTAFVGPDGLTRSMTVTGIPDEVAARAFLKHMGWEDVRLRVDTE